MTFIVPMAIMLVSIPDSFAGERERHTLETLLASRLPDRAILYGKLIVPVMFTWAVLAVSHVTALIIFNAAHWDGGFRVHPPVLMVSIVGFGLLLPLLAGTIGVMISLRAATVQEAAQSLAMAVFSPLVALQIGGAVAFGMGRDRIEDIVETLKAANWTIIVVLVLAGLAAVTFLMLTAVAARFKRSRLIAG
jgi:ABC-2 type transport system permease protein